MRCFSCDRDVGHEGYDHKTTRSYCSPCFSWTENEIMRLSQREAYDIEELYGLQNSPDEEIETFIKSNMYYYNDHYETLDE